MWKNKNLKQLLEGRDGLYISFHNKNNLQYHFGMAEKIQEKTLPYTFMKIGTGLRKNVSAVIGQLFPNLRKGIFMWKNKYLKQLLAEKGTDNEDTWRSIMISLSM